MFDIIAPFGRYLLPYLSEIATAIIACLLVMFGSDINRLMRRLLSGRHFILRTLAFIALNAFGYGVLIIYASPLLAKSLRGLAPGTMAAVVMVTFILIGSWAQRNRQV